MSREVKIHNMPEEKESLFSEGMNKLVATIITGLIIVVIGQGLLIWKNQDNILGDIEDIQQDIGDITQFELRLVKMEQHKLNAFNRITVLEQEAHMIDRDRNNRGGSYRRDDADKMRKELETRINQDMGKIAALEWKLNNINDRLKISTGDVKEFSKESEKKLAKLKEEHKDMRKEILENSAEDNIRHSTVLDRQNTMSDAIISLNNEFDAYRKRIDKIVVSCENKNGGNEDAEFDN